MKNSMQLFAEFLDVGTQVVMSILNEVVCLSMRARDEWVVGRRGWKTWGSTKR
jgi:hypothetical protein